MIAFENENNPSPAVVAVDIGNSSIKLGIWANSAVRDSRTVGHSMTEFEAALAALRASAMGLAPTVVLASVVPTATAQVSQVIESAGAEALVVGEDIPLPIPLSVEEPESVGVDRVCQAAAAHHRTAHACAIVAFGTAITVDLVGDDGVFMGGAILPGLRLQAEALHRHTAQLPLVELIFSESLIGKNTEQAIQNGILYGTIGAVRALIERYASDLGTWPQVVATGGDIHLLARELDFVDSLVPDLCLIGIGLAWARHVGITERTDE